MGQVMTTGSGVHEVLLNLLGGYYPQYILINSSRNVILDLSRGKATALVNLLEKEILGIPSFTLRDKNINDYYYFDWEFSNLLSEILNSSLNNSVFGSEQSSIFFNRDVGFEQKELHELKTNGYCNSHQSFNTLDLDKYREALGGFIFSGKRGKGSVDLTGHELLEISNDYNNKNHKLKGADTFWIKDSNVSCHNTALQQLAYDPYILSIAANYLGCCPIHVQTNLWFSFPTKISKENLHKNAQMFHQDKEFVKFIKVFIYLNDVSDDNGPHCYIEGSHREELNKFGIPFSERVSDEIIGDYYSEDRLKEVKGKAGTLIFGDTSSVHKGAAVKKGKRIMLQLEYASSLYLSPVSPFSDIDKKIFDGRNYSDEIMNRLALNYNSSDREEFNKYKKNNRLPNRSFLRKISRALKNKTKGYFYL